ncbi:Transient receptor potential channel pyrexia [Orchesella cincta]|uniref:Transient receptor potential channel pyrexia n=1 Tax=Orchesella cincta TaxID=48709 RepID=A0A1D2MYW0_ORCCI|nr:Transient receptor potential channel pyrexia [Orchesella cincta]
MELSQHARNVNSGFNRTSIYEWFGTGEQEFPLHEYEGIEVIEIISGMKNIDPVDTETEEQILYAKLLKAAITGSDTEYRVTSSAKSLLNVVNRLDDQQGASPLHYAALMGHYNIVIFLLDNGADANTWDRNNKVTPLICASAFGHLEIVRALVEDDADINAGLDTGTSALLWAARKGHTEVVAYLLKQKANQNSAVMYSETPIHSAVLGGYTEILKLLIGANGKADLSMDLKNKITPLHIAASGEYPKSLECCKLLLHEGKVQVNAVTSRGQTPLHIAGTSFDPYVVKLLISNKAYVDALDNEGRTPLFYFICDDKYALECIQLLVNAKCNVNLKDKSGYTCPYGSFQRSCGSSRIAAVEWC